MEKIISVTDLVRNAARIAKDVEMEGTVYRITRGGRGSMVLVDEEYFDGWMAALDEMRRPDWREVLTETQRDFAAAGEQTTTWNADCSSARVRVSPRFVAVASSSRSRARTRTSSSWPTSIST